MTGLIGDDAVSCTCTATITEVILLSLDDETTSFAHVGSACTGGGINQCVLNVDTLLSDGNKDGSVYLRLGDFKCAKGNESKWDTVVQQSGDISVVASIDVDWEVFEMDVVVETGCALGPEERISDENGPICLEDDVFGVDGGWAEVEGSVIGVLIRSFQHICNEHISYLDIAFELYILLILNTKYKLRKMVRLFAALKLVK